MRPPTLSSDCVGMHWSDGLKGNLREKNPAQIFLPIMQCIHIKFNSLAVSEAVIKADGGQSTAPITLVSYTQGAKL